MATKLSTIILTAGAASAQSSRYEMTSMRQFSMSLTVTVTSANLQAKFGVIGSDFDTPPVGGDPGIIGTTAISALPSGVTFDNVTTGQLTFNNPAVGTYTIIHGWQLIPKWIAGNWIYTSGGGGGLVVTAALSAWQ